MSLSSLKPRGTRRLIYNSDPSNTTGHLSDPTQPEELRDVVRNYAREGNIDTLVQEVFAEAMTMFWRTEKCPYDIRPHHQRMVPMMDDGLMPIEVYIDECHKQGMEFFAGFRMNDRHGHHPEYFEKLSRETPEWILTDYKPSWSGAPPESHEFGCSVNYAIPEVRDWLLSIMREVAHRFDVDGIEFNFIRLAECFPKGETAESHLIMTDFIRRVREMLDDAEKKKEGTGNRKLILGVRVPQQLAGCKQMGFDVPTWIEEGLVGYVAPSDFGYTDINERYEDFVSLAREHDCYIYPQIQAQLSYKSGLLMAPAQYRGAARNFYAAGADGLSTHNYFLIWQPTLTKGGGYHDYSGDDIQKFPDTYPTAMNDLKELKSPESIASGDRHYVFLPIWREGHGPSGIYVREEIVLSRKECGQRDDFRFRVCENFPAEPVLPLTDEGSRLVFFPLGMIEGDEIEVDINGTAIPSEHLSWKWPDDDQPPACSIALSSPPFVYGDNYLGAKLTESANGAEGDIKIERVECMVRALPASAGHVSVER